MDFQGMKRKKLQALCKKHGIPRNLKNIEMANRLATLFQDQTSPVRFKAMSDVLSRCSVIESQRDGPSADDESLVPKKTDETLVTSEYNTVEEEEKREISKEGCMIDVHCVSNPESERHGDGDLSERVLLLLGDYGLDEEGKQEEHTATESPDESDGLNTSQNEVVRSVVVDLHDDESNSAASLLRQSCVGDFNGDGPERNEEIRTGELHCESGTVTSSNRRSLLGSFVAEKSGGTKAMEFHEESVVFTGINNAGESASLHSQLLHGHSGDKKELRTAEEAALEFPEESELGEAAKSEENKALELQVDCDNMSVVMGDFEPHIAGKQGLEEVEFKDESAFFTRFETCLLLGESTQERPGNSKSFSSHHDSSPKVINDNLPPLDLGENTFSDSSGSIASKVFYSHVFNNALKETAAAYFMSKGSQAENVAVRLLTGPILVKKTVSTLIAKEDTKNNEETVLKEHSFVAKLAEAEAVLENSDVHLTLSINNADSSYLDDSDVFTTPERNLMMMEQLTQNGNTLASDSVTHHSDEAVESHAVVFTTPEQVLLLSDYGLDEVGKQVDCDNITGANIITAKSMDAERNVSFSSYVIAGTCSLVPEESSPFTYIHDQINDVLEELVITGDELTETKVTTQRDDKGSLMLDSSGDSRRMSI